MKSGNKILRNALRVTLTAIIVFAAAGLITTPQADVTPSSQGEVSDQVIVEIKPGASIDNVNQRNGTTTIQRFNGTNFYCLHTPPGKTEKKTEKILSRDPDVLSVTSNTVLSSPLTLFGRRTLAFPSNHAELGHTAAEFTAQTFLSKLRLSDALARSTGKGAVVAVIDTGVDINHPALAGHLWVDDRPNPEIAGDGIDNDGDGYIDDYAGWNFVDNNNDVSETPGDPETTIAGHGTFIAGLISLLAPDAKIMPVKAFPPSGLSNAFIVAAAVKYAADHGANVINLSFGSPNFSSVLGDAISDAQRRGILVVAAVGNNGKELSIFPANNLGVLGTAAINNDDILAPFSNFGSDVQVDAPGVDTISAYPGGQYAKWSGTSFAAPLVAAEGALIRGNDRFVAGPADVITSTALSIDGDNPQFAGKLGRGVINPAGALESMNAGDNARLPRDVDGLLGMAQGYALPSARGYASVWITGPQQVLSIYGYALEPRVTYQLLIDGSPIDGAVGTSSDMGSISVTLSNQSGPGLVPMPPNLLPVTGLRHLELRNAEGESVLVGTFSAIAVDYGPTYQTLSKEAKLNIPNGDGSILGRVTAEIDVYRETLSVQAEGITAQSCQILADGVTIGSVTPDAGYVYIAATSDGSSGYTLPVSLRPVVYVKQLQIKDAATGALLLQADFESYSDVGGGEEGGPGYSIGENFTFQGVIQSLPATYNWIGDWVVGTTVVHVNASTVFKVEGGGIAVGGNAIVTGVVQADGSIIAQEVDLTSGAGQSPASASSAHKKAASLRIDGGSTGASGGELKSTAASRSVLYGLIRTFH